MKYIALALLALSLIGCAAEQPQENVEAKASVSYSTDSKISVVEVDYGGETHEYVLFRSGYGKNSIGGINHLPNCKYCKSSK